MKANPLTAAIVIIGDEILSGRVQDVNVNYICRQMFDMGVQVQEVRMVPDIEDEIIFAVNQLRKKYSYVFTTGGIGPTHDDITAASIAKAFGRDLVVNQKALEIQNACYEKRGVQANENTRRMVLMPENCGLIMTTKTSTPSFFIENVFVMAGIPEIMIDMFEDAKKHIKKGNSYISRQITIKIAESKLADILEETHYMFEEINVGSYPYQKGEDWYVDAVVTGKDMEIIDQALNMIKNHLLSQKIFFEEK